MMQSVWAMNYDLPHSIYFILAPSTGLVKIGRAKDVSKRLRDLGYQSPCDLKLIGFHQCKTYVEAREMEFDLHKMFKSLRHHGEWYRYTGGLKRFLDERQARLDALV